MINNHNHHHHIKSEHPIEQQQSQQIVKPELLEHHLLPTESSSTSTTTTTTTQPSTLVKRERSDPPIDVTTDNLKRVKFIVPNIRNPEQSKETNVTIKVDEDENVNVEMIDDNDDEGSTTLDKYQRCVVNSKDSCVMVCASPGSGKTLTMTMMAKKIINDDSHARLLILTFSKDASVEADKRLHKYEVPHNYNVMTIHAFALSICRMFGTKTQIVKRDYLLEKLKEKKKEMKWKFGDFKDEQELLKWLEREYGKGNRSDSGYGSFYKEAFEFYESIIKEFLVLPSLVYEAEQIMKTNQNAKQFYHSHFTHILVDEFQDTSDHQYSLISLVKGLNTKIIVFGDKNQSIYGFIGSNPRIFEKFQHDYPNTRVFHLVFNYRSNKTIVNLSNKFFNTKAKAFHESTTPEDQGKIEYKNCSGEGCEMDYIVSEISKLLEQGVQHKDIAVLLRRQRLRFELMKRMNNKKIKIAGETVFHYLAVAQMLKITYCKYKDKADMKDCLPIIVEHLKPFFSGIGTKFCDRFISGKLGKKTQAGKTFEVFMENMKELSEFFETNKIVKELLGKICQLFDLDQEDISLNFSDILEKELSEECITQSIEMMSFEENTDLDTDGIQVTTIHKAKGREWEYVFIPEIQEGVIPLKIKKAKNEKREEGVDMSEEERIFYVALTRAKKSIYLSCNTGAFSHFLNRLK